MPGMEQVQGIALQQTLSPQMQQSLHLLQAPVLELRQLVREELEQNPALEEEAPVEESGEENFEEEFEQLSRLDDEWREYLAQSRMAEGRNPDQEERRQHLFDSLTVERTLQEELLDQLALSDFPEGEDRILRHLIGNLDEDGLLRPPLGEMAWDLRVEVSAVEAALLRLQGFDPAGVGARDLGECLALQLERQGEGDSLATKIVRDCMPELGRRKFQEIARKLHVPVAEVQAAAHVIARLDPRPGRQFSAMQNQVVTPDLAVFKEGGVWQIELNHAQVPRLRISRHFKELMASGRNEREVRDYIREKVKSGKFLIRSIEQRQQTIFNIATEILRRQMDFFELGPSQLRPMTMSQVADAVGLHETTVSRAVSGKYMMTPYGLFEMKSFFTSGYATANGVEVSNKSVKDRIADLVSHEDPAKPYSDEEIVRQLAEGGIRIARRTIAKYRDQLGILPSHMRRSF